MDLVIEKTNNYNTIYEAMEACKDSFFNQSLNNENELRKQSEKFAKLSSFIVAKINNSCVGYLAFYRNDQLSKQAFLSMIVIHHSYQNYGLGRLLMNYLICEVKINDFNSIKLEVDDRNKIAILFYKNLGFKFVSTASDKSSYYLLDLKEEK